MSGPEHAPVNRAASIVIVGVLLCHLAQAGPQEAARPARASWESFDRVLQSILEASRDRFRRVEGVRIENRRREFYFEAKTYLPQASYCRILEGPVYCCEWDAKGPSAALSVYEKLVGRIKGAVGEQWAQTARMGKARKDTLFRAEGRAIVQAIWQSDPPKVYVLVLPPGSSNEGYTGNIPSIENFLHP
ncbi:MAG TPA: hypothetical protein VFA33_01185 [Bryobacteraceae bacterium]|nr:hypothetical protein [Bryobacteraceae bacterium]